jgi:hypothetical protein
LKENIGEDSVAEPECLSRIQSFSIPDPIFFHPGSASKNLTIVLTPEKLFLGSRKYDPGLFIPDPDPDFYPTYPRFRSQESESHRIPDPDPQHWAKELIVAYVSIALLIRSFFCRTGIGS